MSSKECRREPKVQREAPYQKEEVIEQDESHLPEQPVKLVQAVEKFFQTHWETESGTIGLMCGLDVNGDPIEECKNQYDADRWPSKPLFEKRQFSHAEFLGFTWHHPSTVPDPLRNNFACVETGKTEKWRDVVAIFNSLAEDIKPYFSVSSTWSPWSTYDNTATGGTKGRCTGCLWVQHHFEKSWPNYAHITRPVTSQFVATTTAATTTH
jgi:hypothetical protein